MSAKLQYLYNFTDDDVVENREGELSERQIEDLLQPLDGAFGLFIQSIFISVVGILLAYGLSTVDRLPFWAEIGLVMSVGVMLMLPIWAYINYWWMGKSVDRGDVGTLSRVRKQDFIRTVADVGEKPVYWYEAGEATIIFDQETINALEPDVYYNIYFWTDSVNDGMGNGMLSIETVSQIDVSQKH